MAKSGVSKPPDCRQVRLFLSCKITIRSGIARSEKESPRLRMCEPYEQQWPSFCLHLLHLCSLWGMSSEWKLHFSFSAISRRAWRQRLLQDGETSLRALPASTIQLRVRESPTQTLPPLSRLQSLIGTISRTRVIKSG